MRSIPVVYKTTRTRQGRCRSCAAGTCIVHPGGHATPRQCTCTGGQHTNTCRIRIPVRTSP